MAAWRKVRFAGYAAGGLLALIGLLLALAHTPPAKRFALERVVLILRGLGIDFDASSLDYSLFSLRFDLRNVKVRSTHAPDLPPLVAADRLTATLDLARLLAGAYQVNDAAIDNPQVDVVFTPDGRGNIPRLPSSTQSTPPDYLVRRLRISGGAVRLEQRKQQITAFLPLDRLAVDGDLLTKAHHAQLLAKDGGYVALGGRTLPLRGLAADAVLQNDTLDVRSLRAQAGDSSLALSGRISPNLDIRADANLAIESLMAFAGQAPAARGTLSVAIAARGALDHIQATARIRGDGIAAGRFDRVKVDANAAYDQAASRIQLVSLDLTVPWGTIRSRGGFALNGVSSAEIRAENVNLSRLSAVLKMPVRIASTAVAHIQASWPGLQFEQVAGDAVIKLSAQRQPPTRGVIPVEGTVHATARANRVTVQVELLRALGATVSGELALVHRKSLSGELRVEARIATALAALGRNLSTPIDGSLASTVALAGSVTQPVAAVNAAVPDLSAGTLKGVAVNAIAVYSPGRLSIEDAAVHWQAQTLHASGTIGLDRQQALQVTARAERLSVPAILAGLGRSDLPVAGDLAFVAEVNGTVDSPRADVSLTGSGLRAYGEDLGALALRARVRGEQVEVNELLLDKGSLRASGAYDLASKQYRFAAAARDLRLSRLTLPDGTAVRGAIDLAGAGRGTFEDPGGDLKLTANGIQVGARDFGRAEVTLRAAARQVDVAASVPEFNLSASGRIGVSDPYPATVQVRLAKSDLARFPGKLPQPLEGTLSAVIDAAGDLANYEQGAARAEISGFDVKWKGEPVQTEGPLVAHYAAGTLMIEKAVILSAGSRVAVKGSLPLDSAAAEGAIQLDAQLNLPGLARWAPLTMELQGTVSAEGTVRGTLRRVDPELTVSLENGSLAVPRFSPALTNGSLRGRVRDGALEIETASANWGEAAFSASGVVPFALLPADLPVELPRRQGSAKLTADLKGVNFAAIEGMPPGITGTATARIEAEAPAPELEAVQATLTFTDLNAMLDAYAVAQDGPSEIAIERGIARVRRFRLTGPATEIQLSGTAELTGRQALDLALDAKADASVAAAFTEAMQVRGASEVHAAVTGTLAQPQAKGYVQITDGQLSMQDPRIGMEGLNLRVDLAGAQATISRLEGQVNGGTLTGGGSIAYGDGTVRDADLRIGAEDLYLDFPVGLKTVSDVRLQLKSLENRLALRGSVLIKEGGFTDDLNFDKGILAAVTAPRSLDLAEEPNRLLKSVGINVSVVTRDPIVVENNLAKAEITTQLVFLGSPHQPGLAGRLVIEEGSELTLQERRYEVSRGIITFTNERRIEPSLDLEATTTASNYDITLRISGPPGETKTELSSNPILPQQDILSLLVTGKTLDEIRGQEFQVAQNQMLSYLTGRVGSTVGRQVERATGLSRVRIEPNLIAAETTPSARLTVGQDINRQMHLVYSMDLVNSSDQIYVAEYDLTRRFVTRGVRQSDGSWRFDFKHDLRFGGVVPPPRSAHRNDRRIGDVTILGDSYFTRDRILDRLKVKPGDRYDFFKVRRGLDRVNRLYVSEGLLESNVRLRREQKNNTVDLNVKADPGPKVEFVFEGASVPGAVDKEVRRVWSSGVFDTQRTEDATGVLRAWLIGEKHLTAEVKPEITAPAPGRKRVLFDIRRGPKFESVEWVFEGARGVESRRLRDVIESHKLATEVYTRASRVTELLTHFYHEIGYLDGTVGEPRYELNAQTRTGRVVFPVNEGPLYRVGEARFEGAAALNAGELAEAAPLPHGEVYRPVLRENAIERLREAYWARGYNDVEIDARLERASARGVADLSFSITENARGMVQEVIVEGNRNTGEGLIRTQLEIKPGDPVNLQKIGNSRRKLYNTGAYSVVDISRERVESGGGAPETDVPVRLHVKVQEIQPFELRYGGFYDTDNGPGGIADFSIRNTLGSARVLGMRGRYDSRLREARFYFSQPLLTRFPLKTLLSPYVQREIHPESSETSAFNVDRRGFSLQQQAMLRHNILLDYGYRIEQTHTYDTGPDLIFDVRLRLASLTSTVSRDTRDEILDATKGSFFSHALQFSPESLGSEVSFIKYFGQYFRYFPLQKPRVELFTNQVLRPRLVYATAVRVGLAHGLGGDEIPPSERFLTGGANSIRGFLQDSVGAVRVGGITLGGGAMLVLNNELRFPVVSIFDGAGFLDVGNVYAKISDISLTDVRKSAGMGIRVRTPWFLIRLDYGFKLDRRPGESMGRIFFSIGQAF